MILFINACVKKESRTLRLAKRLLSGLGGQYEHGGGDGRNGGDYGHAGKAMFSTKSGRC